ncbi:MAG: flavodoxin family protein [Bacillota bacterium]
MIRIAAIYGSPRRNQNSDMLLDKVLEGIGADKAAVVKIYASSPDIQHCNSCSRCFKEGNCIIKDEMQEIYKILDKADIVITATPVYFHNVTSHLKKLIDRCQAVWASKYILNDSSIIKRRPRLGYVVCTAGPQQQEDYFDCTLKTLDIFHKCINARITGKLIVSNVDNIHIKENAAAQKEAVKEGKKLRKMMEEIKKIE